MDPSLLKQREEFKKRTMAIQPIPKELFYKPASAGLPTTKELLGQLEKPIKLLETNKVEAKTSLTGAGALPTTKDIFDKMVKPRPTLKCDFSQFSVMPGHNPHRYTVLAKIVNHMRSRFLAGDNHSLTIPEILDETHQMWVDRGVKQWLFENMPLNEKIAMPLFGRFVYKPMFELKDGKGLMLLLKRYYRHGLGGILLDDLMESLPNCKRIIKNRMDDIEVITRPRDKKQVLFFKDRSVDFVVDDDIKEMWNSAPNDGLHELMVEEYAHRQELKKRAAPQMAKRKTRGRKGNTVLRDNVHVADMLEMYETATLEDPRQSDTP